MAEGADQARTRCILIVEDEEFVRRSMAEVLGESGFRVLESASVEEAEGHMDGGSIDVVLTDLRLGGRDGMELVRRMEKTAVPVVMITGHGTVPDAVAAMKAGAYDFVQKPIEPEQLVLVLERALEHGRLVDEVARLRDSVERLHGRGKLAGRSGAMDEVRRMISQVARTDATVLVTGESGTGKELVARALHAESPRCEGPLIQVNCAAVVTNLFESEFFGHRKGAFSGADADRKGRFAEAQGGTLVLDEIETLVPDCQAKLLRVLENGEYQRVGDSRTQVVDVRVVAVSNEELAEKVREGTFRADFYHRLNVFPIEMPPLRDHLEDLPAIVEELTDRVRVRIGRDVRLRPLGAEALEVLQEYDWPGNVRELRNVLERAAILAHPTGEVGPELLRTMLWTARGPEGTGAVAIEGEMNLRARLEEVERELLANALARASGSRKEAAGLLGIDPKNLSYYLNKHGLGSGG